MLQAEFLNTLMGENEPDSLIFKAVFTENGKSTVSV